MRAAAALVLAGVLGAGPAVAAEVVRHSGTLRSVDAAAGRVVLGEIGPWRVIGGRTQVTELSIRIGADTHVLVVRRAPNASSGFVGDFVEEPARVSSLRPGDFLTVDCVHAGPHTTAHMLIVVRSGPWARP